MEYYTLGDNDCPMIEFHLNRGEHLMIERGSMAYMRGVKLNGKLNSKGGILGAIARSIASGESMFITEAAAEEDNALLGIAPAVSGMITRLAVGRRQYRLNTGAFLACTPGVGYNIKAQKFSRALFGGTGGFFVMETEGQGDVLVDSFGGLVSLQITPDRPLAIDNDHVIAWDSTLDYHIEVASGLLGFTTGEGLVNRFEGNGAVLIQTRNISGLAGALVPYLPKSSGD